MFCPFCGKILDAQNPINFCAFCGWQLPNSIAANAARNIKDVEAVEEILQDGETCDELITRYFREGYAYNKILFFLEKYHVVKISLRTLHTKLRSLSLRRRNNQVNMNHLRERIQAELDGPGNSGGYSSVWHTSTMEGVQVPREAVRLIVKELDPEGVRERRARTLRRRAYHSPGQNSVWHVHGYDKLKPYGFPIHGCIDGYSRKILWLIVSRSNNDPALTGQHYLNAIQKFGGCPTLLRADNGTENVTMAAMQAYLYSQGEDDLAGANAHRYGSSPANQRVEAWWAFLRKNRTNWWINLFKDLIDTGELNTSDDLQRECLWC